MPLISADDIDGLGLQRLTAGKAEQPLHQGPGAVRCLQGVAEQARRTRILVGILLVEEVERAGDRGQQIVEVVRDAAGQLAQGFELLDLVQLRAVAASCSAVRSSTRRSRSFGKLVELLETRSRIILPPTARAAPIARG